MGAYLLLDVGEAGGGESLAPGGGLDLGHEAKKEGEREGGRKGGREGGRY